MVVALEINISRNRTNCKFCVMYYFILCLNYNLYGNEYYIFVVLYVWPMNEGVCERQLDYLYSVFNQRRLDIVDQVECGVHDRYTHLPPVWDRSLLQA